MPLIPTLPVKPEYRPQAEDTSIEADVFYFTALRQKSQLWRMERFITFNRSTRPALFICDQQPVSRCTSSVGIPSAAIRTGMMRI